MELWGWKRENYFPLWVGFGLHPHYTTGLIVWVTCSIVDFYLGSCGYTQHSCFKNKYCTSMKLKAQYLKGDGFCYLVENCFHC